MTAEQLRVYLDHAKNFVAMGKVVALMTASKYDDTAVAKADAALRLLAPFLTEEWMVQDLKGFWRVFLSKVEVLAPDRAADLRVLFGDGT